MTDFPDWQQPAANATAIAATGVPLLRGTNTLGTGTGVNLPTSLPVALVSTAAITQPSYEGIFSLSMGAGLGSTPFASLIFNWFDSVTGLNIDSEFFALPIGNGPANALQCYLRGPCHGDQLSVQITNLDGSAAATLTWALNQTSHTWLTPRIIQPVYAATAPNGFTNPAGTPGIGVLAQTQPTIVANGTPARLCAAYSGKALLGVDNAGGTVTIWVDWEDPGTLYSSNPNARLGLVVVNAGASIVEEIALPHGPVNLVISNKSGTTSVTPHVTLTALDY